MEPPSLTGVNPTSMRHPYMKEWLHIPVTPYILTNITHHKLSASFETHVPGYIIIMTYR